jgi:hypothetical protein
MAVINKHVAVINMGGLADVLKIFTNKTPGIDIVKVELTV